MHGVPLALPALLVIALAEPVAHSKNPRLAPLAQVLLAIRGKPLSN